MLAIVVTVNSALHVVSWSLINDLGHPSTPWNWSITQVNDQYHGIDEKPRSLINDRLLTYNLRSFMNHDNWRWPEQMRLEQISQSSSVGLLWGVLSDNTSVDLWYLWSRSLDTEVVGRKASFCIISTVWFLRYSGSLAIDEMMSVKGHARLCSSAKPGASPLLQPVKWQQISV
jgi:hypothetical protein